MGTHRATQLAFAGFVVAFVAAIPGWIHSTTGRESSGWLYLAFGIFGLEFLIAAFGVVLGVAHEVGRRRYRDRPGS